MNLEVLQEIWQENEKQRMPQYSSAELHELLLRQSRENIARLNRTLMWEIGAILVLLIAFAGMMYGMSWMPSWGEWLVLLGFGGVCFQFYRVKYKAINAVSFSQDSLKASVKEARVVLDRYIRFYRLVSFLWVPVLAGFSLIYGMQRFAAQQGILLSEIPLAHWGIISAILLAFVGGMVVLAHWYTRRVYQSRLDSLSVILLELEEQSEV